MFIVIEKHLCIGMREYKGHRRSGKCKLIELIDANTRITDALEEISESKTEEI